MGRLLSTHIQHLVITGAGVEPTLPSPLTASPSDSTWVAATDIMQGEFAYNITDDTWFYRNGANSIIKIGKAATQAQVNTGTATGVYVDPSTLKNSTQWDTKANAKEVRVLVDGATIATDLQSEQENWSRLNTSQTAIARSIINFADNTFETLFVYKAIAGTCTITFSGTNLVFVDLNADTKLAPGASVAIALDGGAKTCYEITLKQTGLEDPDTAGSKIVTVATV